MVYLDHATTSWPKAPGVADAIAHALTLPGSAHRGASAGALGAQAIDERLRIALAGVVHASDPRRMVLTSGATEALNVAILGVVRAAHASGAERPRIVTTQIEHNAVRRPLLALAALGQIDLEVIPASRDTITSPLLLLAEAQASASRPPADLVAMTWASNVTGALQPVEEVAAGLRGTPTLLLVDASQTAGLIHPSRPLEEVGIDLMAFSGHKALAGPPGIGALYVGPRAHPLALASVGASLSPGAGAPRLAPILLGGAGSDSASEDMPRTLPHRFEPGTASTPARAGLLAALGHAHPAEHALAHARQRADSLRSMLGEVRGVHLLGPETPGTGVVALSVEGFAPDEVAAILDAEFGITVRAGLHCAPGAHEAMGTLDAGGCIRASVRAGTTPQDIEALARALHSLASA